MSYNPRTNGVSRPPSLATDPQVIADVRRLLAVLNGRGASREVKVAAVKRYLQKAGLL